MASGRERRYIADDAVKRNPTRNTTIYYVSSKVPRPPVNINIMITVYINYTLYTIINTRSLVRVCLHGYTYISQIAKV